MKFLDQAKVFIRSGDGGAGCVGFHRAAFIEFGGPDGGDGGRGGDVVAECVDGLNTLIDYRYQQHFKAQNGRPGAGSNRTGPSGEGMVLRLPVGTQILDEDRETVLADLAEVGQRVVLEVVQKLAPDSEFSTGQGNLGFAFVLDLLATGTELFFHVLRCGRSADSDNSPALLDATGC